MANQATETTTQCLRDPGVVAAFGCALLLRIGLVAWLPDPAPVNDEIDYWRLAEGLARGEGFASTFRPPLHPAFMAGIVGLGGGAVAVRLAQAVIGSVAVLAVAWLGERLGGRVAARVAALGLAFDPVLVGFSHLLWSETLYITLLLVGCLALVASERGPRPGSWLAGGVCLGLAALARPQLLTFLPLLLPWTAWQVRRRGPDARRAAVFAFLALTVGVCAVVLPWSVRNLRATGAFFLVDTNGPYNLLVATEPGAHGVDKDDRWSPAWAAIGRFHYANVAEGDPGVAQSLALRRAWRRIVDDPGRFAAKSLWEAGHLFTLDNFILRHLRNDWYGVSSPHALTALVTIWCALWTAALYAGGGAGLLLHGPGSPLRDLALLAVLHAVVIFGLTYSLSRYAVPLRPLLLLGLAWLVANAGAAVRSAKEKRGRALACATLAVWLVAAWVRDVPLLADLVFNGGAAHPFVRGVAP